MRNRILQLYKAGSRDWIAFILLIAFVVVSSSHINGLKTTNNDVRLSDEELRLYDLLMDYRSTNGLKKIPLSKSLTLVAQTHVQDLATNNPATGKCNEHSWSNKGKWKACCYTPDHAKATCMWDKPKELTSYTANGYEIAAAGSENIVAAKALSLWKGSKHHNQVILNKGIWTKLKWNAVGIGVNGKYAVVWFGDLVDKEGEPGK